VILGGLFKVVGGENQHILGSRRAGEAHKQQNSDKPIGLCHSCLGKRKKMTSDSGKKKKNPRRRVFNSRTKKPVMPKKESFCSAEP